MSAERRLARVHGWHRALKMWRAASTAARPNARGWCLACCRGGTCQGMVFRIAQAEAPAVMDRVWACEMVTAVYDPRWLTCHTPGPVKALAFTLSRKSPSHTGRADRGAVPPDFW